MIMIKKTIEKTITDNYINKMVKHFTDCLDHCEYEKDGIKFTKEFNKKSTKDNITEIFIYFDDLYLGDISNIKIIDVDGDVAIEVNETFEKTSDNGLYILFRYTFKETYTELKTTKLESDN